MRKKNRQIKITLDIPEQYENDEDFVQDLAEQMDAIDWKLNVEDEDGIVLKCPISKIQLGELEIGPEEEKDNGNST